MEGEPFDSAKAKRLIRGILEGGAVTFTGHALREMEADDLQTVDAVNVLRGGVIEPPELEKGTYRYRVRTSRICVVVAFRSSRELAVVTAWRIER